MTRPDDYPMWLKLTLFNPNMTSSFTLIDTFVALQLMSHPSVLSLALSLSLQKVQASPHSYSCNGCMKIADKGGQGGIFTHLSLYHLSLLIDLPSSTVDFFFTTVGCFYPVTPCPCFPSDLFDVTLSLFSLPHPCLAIILLFFYRPYSPISLKSEINPFRFFPGLLCVVWLQLHLLITFLPLYVTCSLPNITTIVFPTMVAVCPHLLGIVPWAPGEDQVHVGKSR